MDAVLAPRLRVALSRRVLRAADDERLVAEVRAGSRSAFEVVYDRHHAGILAFCRHMLGSREEAEDVVQHTFAAAYEALLADQRDITLKAWLYAIARNRCFSVLRGRHEHLELEDAGPTATATAGLSVEVEQREDLRALLGDLQRLPDDQRAALVLAELGAHSHEEIAVILGVPTSKIKALVFQAREALMNRRLAREADCGPIREQLAVLRGGSRRRGDLRNHVAQCEGCRAFEAEVRRQRAGMAVLLPVVPTFALKESSLAAAFAGGGGGAAAAGGAAAGGGAVGGAAAGSATAGTMAAGGAAAGGAAAGGAAAGGTAAGAGSSGMITGGGVLLGAKAIAAKAVIALAVTGSVAGGGYATVKEFNGNRSPAPSAQEAPARFDQPQKLGFKPPVAAPVVASSHDRCPNRVGGCVPQASPDPLAGGRTSGGPNGNGTPNRQDDRDGDGVPDSADNCPSVSGPDGGCPAASAPAHPPAAGQAPGTSAPAASKPGDRDGDGIPNRRDADLDGDGFLNREDNCPTTFGAVGGCPAPASAKPSPAGRTSGDRDGDGVPNRKDGCPTKPGSVGGCPSQGSTTPSPPSQAAGDRDGDGFPNREDNCPNEPGPLGGCPQPPPSAPVPAGPAPGDRDGDGILNSADADRDGDHVLNRDDNCPNKPGPIGGCPEQVPIQPLPAGPVDGDRDGDGIPDNADVDRDGDGFRNREDNCPNRPGTDAGCPVPPPAPPPSPAPAPAPTPAPADPAAGGP